MIRTDHYELEFNLDPVPTPRPRVTKTHTYMPKNYKQFQTALRVMAIKQLNGKPLLEGPIWMDIVFEFARPKTVKREHHTVKPDIDNMQKGVCDSLNGILYKDDSQITVMRGHKKYSDCGKGRILVTAHLIQ